MATTVREKIEVALFALIFVSTAINLYLAYGRRAKPSELLLVGHRFPALDTGSAINGKSRDMAVGQRRVYYWFSPACSYCRKNQESVAQLARSLPKGEFMGVGQNTRELRAYMDGQPADFPVLTLPVDGRTAAKLGGTPTTFVVNASGTIERIWRGAYTDPARSEIERYFGVSLPALDTNATHDSAVPVRAVSRP